MGKKEVKTKEKIEFRGKMYKSINKIAVEVGIPPYTINHRLRQGMSLEDAVNEGRKPKKELEYQGNTFTTIKELSEYTGIGANILVNRLHKGMTVTEAVETPVKKRNRNKKSDSEETTNES